MADVLPAIAGANSSGEMVSGARWGGLKKQTAGENKRDREEMTRQMLMSKLTKVESLLGMQKGMNSALQAKLAALMKKCDEREQRVYTMRTAMQKVERDADVRIAKAEAENKAVLAGQKYEDMKDDLRRRATLIMDRDNAVAKMEKKSSNLERKNGALTAQLSQAKEQTKEAEKQWGGTSKEVVAMKSKQSHSGIKLREAKQSVRFLEVQLEERELEVAKLRVSVQMAEEDLGMAKREIRKQRDRADRFAAESFSPRDVPDIGNSAREEQLEDELAMTHARVADQMEQMEDLMALASGVIKKAKKPKKVLKFDNAPSFSDEAERIAQAEIKTAAQMEVLEGKVAAAEAAASGSERELKSALKKQDQRMPKLEKANESRVRELEQQVASLEQTAQEEAAKRVAAEQERSAALVKLATAAAAVSEPEPEPELEPEPEPEPLPQQPEPELQPEPEQDMSVMAATAPDASAVASGSEDGSDTLAPGHPAFASLDAADEAALKVAEEVANRLDQTNEEIIAMTGAEHARPLTPEAAPAAAVPVAAAAETSLVELLLRTESDEAHQAQMQTLASKHALELQDEFDAMAHLLTEEEKLELQRELLQLHHAMDPDQAAAALAKFDTDGDGKVSSAELRAGKIDLEISKQNAEAGAATADVDQQS